MGRWLWYTDGIDWKGKYNKAKMLSNLIVLTFKGMYKIKVETHQELLLLDVSVMDYLYFLPDILLMITEEITFTILI